MRRAIVALLPQGDTLPSNVWTSRHRWIRRLLWLHVVAIPPFAALTRHTFLHGIEEASLVAVFAVAATRATRRRDQSMAAAIGLLMSSAILVHLSHGLTEIHFHFFVVIGILTLYEDWIPFLIALGFVLVHHGVMGMLDPKSVYSDPRAWNDPWGFASIHGFFVLASSVAYIAFWRSSERVRAEVNRMAVHDALTGLPNRRLFSESLLRAVARTSRQPHDLAVLFLDLDGFKDVNDTMGHDAGDALLRAVADRIRATVRTCDTAARLGGDEFGVLLEDLLSVEDALEIAERLLDVVRAEYMIFGRQVRIGASIGIALWHEGLEADVILSNADLAMYAAKANGKGRYELFAPEMESSLVRRLTLEAELADAVMRDEFVVFFQPILDMKAGLTVGMEALVRWNHPTRGLLLPGEFIGVAETCGAIVGIGEFVVRTACEEAVGWAPDLYVSVNLSPRQLQEPGLVHHVAEVLDETRLAPGRLVFEVTEGLMVNDAHVITMEELRSLGVRLALDDFGVGYSSLANLHRLPIDIVKIDRSLIERSSQDAAGAHSIKVIADLATSAHLELICEGVETGEQVDTLTAAGCRYGQGYFFARPAELSPPSRRRAEPSLG
jgi:diguanylate cyclase